MKKYIILSVNDSPKYLFWVPLTCWAWRQIGWEPFLFYKRSDELPDSILRHLEQLTADCPGGESLNLRIIRKADYPSETIAQCSRLYASCILDGYLMTSDIDMIPLSDYWKPNEKEITSYGRDLTEYHYPICYVGMPSEKWKEVMGIDGRDYLYFMQRDMRKQANMWTLDQDIITEKLTVNPDKTRIIKRIDRGIDRRTGYPLGRVDRSNWRLDHDVLVDAHLPHDILTNDQSFKKVLELLHTVWPKEDWAWFISYYKEFKKLLK